MLNTLLSLIPVFSAAKINFYPQGFLDMLPYMGKGMIVIFVLIGFIILVTLLVNKLFSKKQ